MSKPNLQNVTLVIIDCVNYARARLSFDHNLACASFGDAKLLTHFDTKDQGVVNISKIGSVKDYSIFCVKELANYFDTEFVLVAQWDGFIWHPELWEDEFLKYDYIGAPWTPDTPMIGDHINPPHFRVGNGGFSIRSKRLQDFLRDDPNIVLHRNEDVAICQLNRAYLEKCGFTFAPYEVAERFSLENGPMVPRFGAHARIKLVPPHK
jgi:hypothetical protein